MRASALAAATLLAAVAVFALPAFSGAASASHSATRCPVGGDRLVVARSSRIVVARVSVDRRDGAQRFWCAEWLPTGRTTVVVTGEGPTTLAACVGFDACQFAAQVHVAGDYVACIDREPDPHYDMGIDSISEFNARAGTMVVNANNDYSLYTRETQYPEPNGHLALAGITKLALNTRGDVAWIVSSLPDAMSPGSSAVYEHRPGQSTLTLDTSSPGLIGTLAITATTVTWIDDGVLHSVSS